MYAGVQHDCHIKWRLYRFSSKTTTVNSGTGSPSPYGTVEFTPGFQRG